MKIKNKGFEHYPTIESRLVSLKEGNTLSLAVEGRFTNLLIFTGNSVAGGVVDSVYLRLDKAYAYYAPLNNEVALYLENESKEINQLLKFGFKSSIDNLYEILKITANMSYRELVKW